MFVFFSAKGNPFKQMLSERALLCLREDCGGLVNKMSFFADKFVVNPIAVYMARNQVMKMTHGCYPAPLEILKVVRCSSGKLS